jgi:hypothetical protein
MISRSALQRLTLVAFLVLSGAAPAGCVGCGGDPALPAADGLRRDFPEQAALVLEAGREIVETPDGFGLPAGERTPAGFAATLPKGAADPVRFTLADGLEVQVLERGVVGGGVLEGRAVSYLREGGASFWMTAEGGYEEWLRLDPGATSPERPAAVWEVSGASLRQAGEAIEIRDEDGRVRIRVTAPSAFGDGGEPIEARLVADGAAIELWAHAKDGGAILVDPMWTPVSPMSEPRSYPVGALLPSGKVLIASGYNGVAWTPTAELFDPAANTWSAAPSLLNGRAGHTATVLLNGKVLVVGGYGGAPGYLGGELYNPATNTWSFGGALTEPRSLHAVGLLPNGNVIVAGGYTASGTTSSVEIYNAATNTWSSAAPMTSTRVGATLTVLSSGKVLVAGGTTDTFITLATAALYDPAQNTWSNTASMSTVREFHSAVRLQDGRVLVAGGGVTGGSGGSLSSAEIYDPVTNTWTLTSPMASIRSSFPLILRADGTALATGGDVGGVPTAGAELYDPLTGNWTNVGPMVTARESHAAVTLPDGRVLVAGGGTDVNGNVGIAAAEILTIGAANGAPCASAAGCNSGFCVDGVCCNSACSAGPCDACSIAAGAAVNGTCSLLSGPVCSDGNACSQTDVCQAGVCVGSNPVVCPAADQCHLQGVCSPQTGVCSNPAKPNGSPCSDGSACSQNDACQAGACVPGTPVMCAPLDSCHVAGVCDPATGACSSPAKPDGSACSDNNACSQADICQAGACIGTSPVMCAPVDSCHDVGVCNPQTGTCSSPVKADGSACDDGNACTAMDMCQAGACSGGSPVVCAPPGACEEVGACNPVNGVCSYPKKADGSACDDANACTDVDTCQAGVCAGGPPKVCAAMDECHEAGACDPATGACSSPAKADGAPCSGGVCNAGVCGPTSGAGGSGGAGGAGGGAGGGMGGGGEGGRDAGAGGNASGSGGGDPGSEGGCGCGFRSSSTGGAMGFGLFFALFLRRRRSIPRVAA